MRLNALLGALFALGATTWGLLQHRQPRWMWFLIALGGMCLTWFSLSLIRSSDPTMRARLRQRSSVDLRAAKRLRSLLQRDLKTLAMAKSHLTRRFAPAQQAEAGRALELAEQQTQSELEEVQALIQKLQG